MDRNTNKNWFLLICLVLMLATLAVFCRVCTYDFINYDDQLYVYENPNIQAGITLKAIKWAFTTGYGDFWHPLTWLSYMLDWQLFGLNPAGFHLTNLIFHIANTLILFLVLKRMTNALWQSAFVAALFALHPLHVESVAWVSERNNVLSTFFWLLTMWAYLRYVKYPSATRYLLTLLTFALGLTAKTMLVTLPFVLLLLDYWPLERFNPENISSKWKTACRLVLEKVPFFALSAVSSIIIVFFKKIMTVNQLPLNIRIANAFISYVKYIGRMIWPSQLTVFYPILGQNISVLYVVVSAAILLAVTILVLRFAKNHRYLVTGWFWYLGTLLPVIGLIPLGGHVIADRYTYITLTGLFIIIAWGFPALLAKWTSASSVESRYKKNILILSALLIILAVSICTWFQLRYWRNGLTLFQHALDVTKNNYIAHYCIAAPLVSQGRLDEAIYHYSQAIRILPDYTDALSDLGAVLHREGRIDEAIGYYRRTLEINPRFTRVHLNLAAALADKGIFAEAVTHYKIGLATMDIPAIRRDFGSVLVKLGRFEEAVTEYRRVLSAMPDDPNVLNELGCALTHTGNFDEAVVHFKQALQINPQYTEAKNNLNIALAEKQRSIDKDEENAKKKK